MKQFLSKNKQQLDLIVKTIGVKKIKGSSTKPEYLYHDIPFGNFKSHRRGSALKAKTISSVYKVKDKKGLDIGCSVGGVTFYLQLAGAKMTGVDYDPHAIDFAKTVEMDKKTEAEFVCSKIDLQFVKELKQNTWDFIVWLSQWMWIEKQYGLPVAEKILHLASKATNNLFFQTSQGDGQAKSSIKTSDDVIKLLKRTTDYKIINLGRVKDGKYSRNIFYCER